jgi:hypothetical protein
LIEVKHSCLNLQSKLSGSLDEIREAIRGNIVDGIVQLSRFRYNLEHSNHISIPTEFKDVTDFEHLIITHDNISGLNSIIREQAMIVVSEENKNNVETPGKIVQDNFHVHIVSELERLVEIPGLDLFAFSRSKRDTESDETDFDEYAEHVYGMLPHNNLLKHFFGEFMDGFRNQLPLSNDKQDLERNN